ncbi:transglutaminase-like domain-containing protein [Clostridium sp. 'White wine YQ']|uniref:transglutaminase-like domain-containing protein n=1 Tax=Clostridium sp. 'White wine YQ' TaxID=3027474 RepID=UPI00236630F6|nr:transglutaminase-like domain-containing protein [Clostridium sp. 'White wine YQ']MDD7794029.1 transglutaminase-like domain-containing protein [Clostridium sp. 'White wine YQ']
MKSYYIDILFLSCLLIPIIIGIFNGFKANNFMNEIKSIEESICLIISFFFTINFLNKSSLFNKNFFDSISPTFSEFVQNNPKLSYYIILIICTSIAYGISLIPFAIINSVIINPVVKRVESYSDGGGSIRRAIISGFFKIPYGIILACLFGMMLQGIIFLKPSDKITKVASESKSYQYFYKNIFNPISTSNFAKTLPDLIGDSLKIDVVNSEANVGNSTDIPKGGIVLYNGITLDEGIKSNSEIDSLARSITKNKTSTKEKAKVIYSWVGSNVKYDYSKAEAIMSDNYRNKSGAIEAYNTRKGICFDYACLYVAMARANNLKVRIVVGQGFDGTKWVSHAWNEVYLPEEKRWINVDPTFYVGGNYFDNKNFDSDHKKDKVIGEW